MDINVGHCDVSELSASSSRTEHIAFLTDVLGLDRATAGLLYRAEWLQEKGQLKQAIKYYEQVLSKHPGCEEAAVNLRIVKEVLTEENAEEQVTKLATVLEEESQIAPVQPIVTEMDVEWSGWENARFDYYPEPDKLAFEKARSQLSSAGYGDSLLKLLKNETLCNDCNVETDWQTYMSGRARFQVALIPDKRKADRELI